MYSSLAEFGVPTPSADEGRTSGTEDRKGERHQKQPKADMRSRGVPGNDLLGGVRGLELDGLHVTHKQGRHEQDRGKYQKHFHGRENNPG